MPSCKTPAATGKICNKTNMKKENGSKMYIETITSNAESTYQHSTVE